MTTLFIRQNQIKILYHIVKHIIRSQEPHILKIFGIYKYVSSELLWFALVSHNVDTGVGPEGESPCVF